MLVIFGLIFVIGGVGQVLDTRKADHWLGLLWALGGAATLGVVVWVGVRRRQRAPA